MLTTGMLAKIKSFLSGEGEGGNTPDATDDGVAAAAVAVFVEAAQLDGDFDETERRVICKILIERFQLSAEDAEALINDALREHDSPNKVYAATRLIRDVFSDDERIDVMEMLWEVAYADGEVHDYEANLVRRVAGLLYVQDRESGRARKRVLERLNLDESE